MKKMLFSAIAMVAFAGSALASNEQVEKFEAVVSDTPCADAWSVDYDYYRIIGYSPSEANKRATENFEKCMKTTYDDVVIAP